jgi:hypothetical protein
MGTHSSKEWYLAPANSDAKEYLNTLNPFNLGTPRTISNGGEMVEVRSCTTEFLTEVAKKAAIDTSVWFRLFSEIDGTVEEEAKPESFAIYCLRMFRGFRTNELMD